MFLEMRFNSYLCFAIVQLLLNLHCGLIGRYLDSGIPNAPPSPNYHICSSSAPNMMQPRKKFEDGPNLIDHSDETCPGTHRLGQDYVINHFCR